MLPLRRTAPSSLPFETEENNKEIRDEEIYDKHQDPGRPVLGRSRLHRLLQQRRKYHRAARQPDGAENVHHDRSGH